MLISDIADLLADLGFTVVVAPASTHELRWHAASILASLLGPDVFFHDSPRQDTGSDQAL